MHVQDVDRALGDLLELDDTIRATVAHLEKLGLLEETLILVTADHGHGFDVYGSSDTEYLNAQTMIEQREVPSVYTPNLVYQPTLSPTTPTPLPTKSLILLREKVSQLPGTHDTPSPTDTLLSQISEKTSPSTTTTSESPVSRTRVVTSLTPRITPRDSP
jgi:alkaline phosphatase